MKSIAKILTLSAFAFIMATFVSTAQKVVRVKPGQKTVVVKHKRPRTKSVVVYHPRWAPKKVFYRRWVYFPAYNLYWDNVRELYVYRKGNVWVTSVTVPAFVINVDLSTAKHEELPEEKDSQDVPEK
ncbi:MAG: hypothetical protein H5T24_06990 [Bacteroidales bacterium]|nr:hypothetical protein [Bacteroidales bacterium]